MYKAIPLVTAGIAALAAAGGAHARDAILQKGDSYYAVPYIEYHKLRAATVRRSLPPQFRETSTKQKHDRKPLVPLSIRVSEGGEK